MTAPRRTDGGNGKPHERYEATVTFTSDEEARTNYEVVEDNASAPH
jgi:hypothetical protein